MCNGFTDREIRDAARAHLGERGTCASAEEVYQRLGNDPICRCCLDMAQEIIAQEIIAQEIVDQEIIDQAVTKEPVSAGTPDRPARLADLADAA